MPHFLAVILIMSLFTVSCNKDSGNPTESVSDELTNEGPASTPDTETPADNTPDTGSTTGSTSSGGSTTGSTTGGSSTTGSTGSGSTTGGVTTQTFTQEFMTLVNDHRTSIGLRPLVNDEGLAEIAEGHSADMASKTVAFGHTGFSSRCSEGRSVLGGGNMCGENVAYGQKTPQAVFTSWMNSSGHRANIEQGRYTHSGFGFKKSSSGTYYWTHLFLEKN